MENERTQVSAALIYRDHTILCAKRKNNGLWEFPGGKLEEGESIEDSLIRELKEELEIEAEIVSFAKKKAAGAYEISFFLCTIKGEPVCREHEEICWADAGKLEKLIFSDADQAFLDENPQFLPGRKRIFFALTFGEKSRFDLASIMDRWKAEGIDGRWTKLENLHLTMLFIGETEDWLKAVSILQSIQVPAQIKMLEAYGAGNFKKLYFVRLADNRALVQAADLLREKCTQAHIRFDPKPFKPHITLLRNAQIPEHVKPECPPFKLKTCSLVLYQSIFTRTGVIYKALCTKDVF